MIDEARLHALRERIGRDPFARALGMELLSAENGHSRVQVTLTPSMVNFQGLPHGGVIFTLADHAFAAACNSHGRAALALSVTIDFVAAAPAGATLVAECHELSLGGRIGHYRVEVVTTTGTLIALCQATAYRKHEELF